MPEYLAPDVYVEEVDTGSKPIEGVSTSTTGLLGVTERGPVDVPILVTSAGEYRRWFGELLSADLYGEHRFLPHAIDGFFANGGKRVYVTRVLATDAAANASLRLFRVPPVEVGSTLLARSAAGATAILLVDAPAINPFDWVRVGTGSDAEYRQADSPIPITSPATTVVVLRPPLQFSHATALGNVNEVTALGASPPLALVGDQTAGTVTFTINGVVATGQLLQVNDVPGGNEELIFVQSVADLGGGLTSVTLVAPLQLNHANGEVVHAYTPPFVLGPASNLEATVAGDTVIQADPNTGYTLNNLLQITDGDRNEVRRVGDLHVVTTGVPIAMAHTAGRFVEHVQRADTGTIKTLDPPPTPAEPAVAAGALVLDVNDRQGLTIDQVLRVGATNDPDVEYVVIRDLPNHGVPGADPGRIVLDAPLMRPHGGFTAVSRQIVSAQAITQVAGETAILVHPVAAGATRLLLTNGLLGAPLSDDDLVRVARPGRPPAYVRIAAHAASVPASLAFPLATPLLLPHVAPQPVVVREELMDVVALDPGIWGNRLRVAARREASPLVRTRIRMGDGIQDPTHIRLDSAAGLEPGTVLSLADALGAPVDTPFKVTAIDRQNGYLLTLNTNLPAAAVMGAAVISIEFALGVYLLRQPDPGQPVRNTQVLDIETFRHLSLDPRHSRYVQRVIGTTWTPGDPSEADHDGRPLRRVDRRSEGESWYVRIRDVAQDLPEPARTAALEGIRPGPEFLVDVLPDGRREPTRRALTDGDDQIGALLDDHYIGVDDPEPERRTGLQTFRNIDEISILAAPGRVSAQMQGALITHCELLRYRFAVLDGTPPPTDTLADIQNQRQQFDTKYAALYHPWLIIPHPFPPAPGIPPDYPVPPAGHVLGVYARTDIERGVHKAPANEVVRGIVGLQRQLTKGEHDILNPYPQNINVIRDFRPDNRGIRVYGGRVITSDSDWKYVNVRRLLIFIEASINRGLQWVVFEPNADPLWARVRRSISNFLTLVFRNGALEGTKVEEAYFVKCDRTTMTQTDIDQGRLICLVGVAPVKPAEFVIVRIGLWTAHAED
jgi:phage tail sheath protein FI